MHMEELIDLLTNNPRSKWYDLLQPYFVKIVNKGPERYISLIEEGDLDYYAVIPEELKEDYPWRYNIGDIVTTNGLDRKIIEELPAFDPRRGLEVDRVFVLASQYAGNCYYTVDLDENGNRVELNPDEFYSPEYNMFNENELCYPEESNDMIKYYEIIRSLSLKNRKDWFEILSSHLELKDPEWEGERSSYLFGNSVSFLPEELKLDHIWKFKVGDIVISDDKILYKVKEMPFLKTGIISEGRDLETELTHFGNIYSLNEVDEKGNYVRWTDGSINWAYLNENQLKKVEE